MLINRTLRILKELRIKAILTLTEDDLYGKKYLSDGFFHLHEPIEDCEPPTVQGMDRAIAFIDSNLKKGVGVVAHCAEGRGRTGTVLGAWLGLKESLNPHDTILRISQLRSHTILTPTQRSFLNYYLGYKNKTINI